MIDSLRYSPEDFHLAGGNFYDDLRFDIAKAHEHIDSQTLPARSPMQVGSKSRNVVKLALDRKLQGRELVYPLVASGIRRDWFDEFHGYWTKSLSGRPLQIADFFCLLHDYRKRQQFTHQLDWGDAATHVRNWQDPAQLYSTLHYVRKCAIQPVRLPGLGKLLFPDARVLEYGCSLAPMYRTYRSYFSHIPCRWILADIANFPFHFTKSAYGNDVWIERFLTIRPERFTEPLAGVDGAFDLIVVQEVLEHVDDPAAVIALLIDRLSPQGHIIFDFTASQGTGLDRPSALAGRLDALRLIEAKLSIVKGRFSVSSQGIATCIARLKR